MVIRSQACSTEHDGSETTGEVNKKIFFYSSLLNNQSYKTKIL